MAIAKISEAQELTTQVLDFYAGWESLTGNSHWDAVRKAAIDHLREANFPEAKNEEYKFTNFTKAIYKTFGVGEFGKPSTLDLEDITSFFIPGLAANRVVLVNGEFNKELSELSLPAGIHISSLSDFAHQKSKEFTSVFGQVAAASSDAFTAFNTAFATEGVAITIEKNADIQQPIIIYNIVDARLASAQSFSRVLLIAEEGARAQILSSVHTLGDYPSLNMHVMEGTIASNAEVNLVKVQNDGGDGYHYDHTKVAQQRDSRFTTSTICLRGTLIRNNLEMDLNGEGIESNMYGLSLLRNAQHVDHHTVVDHKMPHSESNELYKAILDDTSTGVFNGKIFVRPDAQKTNAFQSNNTILLSDEATVHTKPQLEIWADDVKCSHGATTGQMDDEQLFYLRARGLGEKAAKAMLLNAFAQDALVQVKQEAVLSFLQNQITERL